MTLLRRRPLAEAGLLQQLQGLLSSVLAQRQGQQHWQLALPPAAAAGGGQAAEQRRGWSTAAAWQPACSDWQRTQGSSTRAWGSGSSSMGGVHGRGSLAGTLGQQTSAAASAFGRRQHPTAMPRCFSSLASPADDVLDERSLAADSAEQLEAQADAAAHEASAQPAGRSEFRTAQQRSMLGLENYKLRLPVILPRDYRMLQRVLGSPPQLEEVLRRERRVSLFNTALRLVPEPQVPSVLELLIRCARKERRAAAAGDGLAPGGAGGEGDAGGRRDSSSGGEGGAGSSSSSTRGSRGGSEQAGGQELGRHRAQQAEQEGCVPDAVTAWVVMNRLEHSRESGPQLDAWMLRLLDVGLPASHRTFLPWAQWHARRGGIAGVRRVMEHLEERRGAGYLSPHYYVQLVRAYSFSGRWQGVRWVLDEMQARGLQPNEYVVRSVIIAFGLFRQTDLARQAFDEQLRAGRELSVPTWCALMNAYADARQPREAVELLVEMRARGLVPNLNTWGSLVKAFARAGDWRRAVQVLDMIRAEGLQPNEQVFGSAIEAAANAGKPEVASSLIRHMHLEGVPPNVIAYTSLLSAYGTKGDLEGAQRVLDEMREAGCAPNSMTYTVLMSFLAEQGRHEDCERIFQRMVSEGCEADSVSYACLIDSMLFRWDANGRGQRQLLAQAERRWVDAATGGPLRLVARIQKQLGVLHLDLHGLSAWTSQLAVLSFLGRLQALHAKHPRGVGALVKRVEIITGRGQRSTVRHQPVLREVCLAMLQRLMPVRVDPYNEGALELDGGDLVRLFERMRGRNFGLKSMHRVLVKPS